VERVTGFDSAGVLGLHLYSHTGPRNRQKSRVSSCCARQRHDAHQGHRPQLRSSSLPSSGLFLALSRAGHESMHWRASSAHHRCLGPFGATRVLVTHHRLHLLELLEVEVSALAAEGGRSTRRAVEALKRHSEMQLERHSERRTQRGTQRGTQAALREALREALKRHSERHAERQSVERHTHLPG
jgi:hypothetical protein